MTKAFKFPITNSVHDWTTADGGRYCTDYTIDEHYAFCVILEIVHTMVYQQKREYIFGAVQ